MTIIFHIVAIFALWIFHPLWVYKIFSKENDVLPHAFQTPYSNICRCSEVSELTGELLINSVDGLIFECFNSNKEVLLNIARDNFNLITHDQFERFVLHLTVR